MPSKAEILAAQHRELLDRIRLLTEQAEAQRLLEEKEEVARLKQEEAARREQETQGDVSEAQAEVRTAKDAAVRQVRSLMDELDVTVVEILASIGRLEPEAGASRLSGKPRATRVEKGQARRRAAPVPYRDNPDAPVRYRDTATGETWSGTGRVPQWIHEFEKRGISRDQFLVA